jgi:hypothetical protein
MGGAEAFVSSFNWRTFDPGKRAERALDDAVDAALNGIAAIKHAAGPQAPLLVMRWFPRFVAKWAKYQAAGARTANPMITGPANFPADRNRKRMDVEYARLGEYLDFANGARAWAEKQLRLAERRAVIAAAPVVEGRGFDGGRYVENEALERVQLVFDGKPDPDVIAQLKRHAFRWAPSLGAWQRQLTPNGKRAAQAVLAFLAARG